MTSFKPKKLEKIEGMFERCENLSELKIKFNVEIDKLINDLKSIKDNYAKKYIAFQNNIEKIFEIINLTYLNYHISSEEEKNQI